MLSRSSLLKCRSALVRAPARQLQQVARASTAAGPEPPKEEAVPAPETPKEEATPAPRKRSIPRATGFEDLLAVHAVSRSEPTGAQSSAQGNNLRSRQEQQKGLSRSYGSIDFRALGDDEFDGMMTGNLARRLQQRREEQVSLVTKTKQTSQATGASPASSTPNTNEPDGSNAPAWTIPAVKAGVAPILPYTPSRPQNVDVDVQPGTIVGRNSDWSERQERRAGTRERSDRSAGAPKAPHSGFNRPRPSSGGEAQPQYQQYRRDTARATTQSSQRRRGPRTRTTNRMPARESSIILDDSEVPIVPDPVVMTQGALEKFFAQPAQSIQAEIPLIKDFSDLSISTAEVHKRTLAQRIQARRALEVVGGDYSRYFPPSLRKVTHFTPLKAGPLAYVHHALARRPAIGLPRRKHALHVVSNAMKPMQETRA